MNLEARKIQIVQEFLNINSEDIISRLEKVLIKEKRVSDERVIQPITKAELNKRIDQSEADFLNNRHKSSAELLTKYQ